MSFNFHNRLCPLKTNLTTKTDLHCFQRMVNIIFMSYTSLTLEIYVPDPTNTDVLNEYYFKTILNKQCTEMAPMKVIIWTLQNSLTSHVDRKQTYLTL